MDFDKICRLCMNSLDANCNSIFNPSNEENLLLATKVMTLAAVQVIYGDDLPHGVCHACTEQLENAYNFKIQCEQSDNNLRKCLLNNFKIIKSESIEDNKHEPILTTEDYYCNDSTEFSDNLLESPYSLKQEEIKSDTIKNSQHQPISTIENYPNENTEFSDNLLESPHNPEQAEIKIETIEHNVYQPIFTTEDYPNDNTEFSDNLLESPNKLKEEEIKIETIEVNQNQTVSTSENYTNDNTEFSDNFEESPDELEQEDVRASTIKQDNETHEFQCSICNKQFQDNKELINHLLKEHTRTNNAGNGKGLVCNICNKVYLKPCNLVVHMRIHTGVKSFECKVCGKCFTQGRAYACHMRVHDGDNEKTCKCGICSKTFSEVRQLSKHMKKHSKSHVFNVSGKNYMNSGNLKERICDKKFAHSNVHSYHMKTHLSDKPYACEVCSKTFKTKGQLNSHRKIHTNERTVCPKSFTQKATLTMHMMDHAKIKPHLCNICGKKYSEKSMLVDHMTSHTANFCGKMDSFPSTSLALTPPKVNENAELPSTNLLSEKSRKAYLIEYEGFNKWKSDKEVTTVSESLLLEYFSDLSEKYKPSTLWRTYSILKSTLSLHENVKIEKYGKLQTFLKRQSEGFEAKKASVFTPEEIHKFINTASNELYFPTKVALIMGVMGACRSGELYNMKLSDVQDVGKAYIIKLPNTKTKITRTFTITDNFYNICKQYINNRNDIKQDFVFLQYRKGICTNYRVGINGFIKMGKDIAKFLELPNAETYSGHSFRRSSATILINAEGNLQQNKQTNDMEAGDLR